METSQTQPSRNKEDVYKAAVVYVAMYNAFQVHLKTCEKCQFKMPVTLADCSIGFFAGLNTKNAHEALLVSV